MLRDPIDAVERNLDRAIDEARLDGDALDPESAVGNASTLTARTATRIFEDMVRSRLLDIAARQLKAAGQGYYTIASAGHEHNAVLATILEPTDPCFLHYRSGAFMMARSRHDPQVDPITETLRSFVAAADDPISQGRHKVWGSRPLWVIPQTSTIGSHLPKAMGAAFAHGRAKRLGLPSAFADDAIIVCSFGDASLNHAAALAGINSARYSRRRGQPVPLLFVCEDNGLGISVDTPKGWVADTVGNLPYLQYVHAAGEIDDVWQAVAAAVAHCRAGRAPVFLHLETVRLWGHAGSDVESSYRTVQAIEADEARDPIVRAARRLIETGAASADTLRRIVQQTRERVQDGVEQVAGAPTLQTRAEVMAPLLSHDRVACQQSAAGRLDEERRRTHFDGTLPEEVGAATRRTLGAHLNHALHDELLRREEAVVFGEDVGRKGGVYHVTAGLQVAFGVHRVFDTLLDETTILGTAQGAGLAGLLPIAEIQYLAYLHNALDQLRGEAASMRFFSAGQFSNPMVVRIAAFAYQKGFGGHFHNDNAVAALREVPGIRIAVPSRGDDAARLLRGALAMAEVDGAVVAFLEPIALYHTKDLYDDGDEGWLTEYPPPGEALLPGEVGSYGPDEADVLVVTYANGVPMSLRAARSLDGELTARVLDLRWLAPLPFDAVREAADACRAVVVVDECRGAGGVADALVSHLAENGYRRPIRSVRAADSYIPLGPAAATVLVTEDEIVAALRALAA